MISLDNKAANPFNLLQRLLRTSIYNKIIENNLTITSDYLNTPDEFIATMYGGHYPSNILAMERISLYYDSDNEEIGKTYYINVLRRLQKIIAQKND
jgi:hypothetical protein